MMLTLPSTGNNPHNIPKMKNNPKYTMKSRSIRTSLSSTPTAGFSLAAAFAAAGLLAFAGQSQAAVYNLNFSGGIGGAYLGNYTGVGAAPDAGTYWNQIQQTQNGIGNYNTSISNLTASDGTTSSGITVAVEYSRAYNDTGISGNNLLGSWLQVDGSVNGGGVGLVTISGLSAGAFDLYLYGINGGFTGRGTRFIFNTNYWTGGTVDPGNSAFHYLQTTGASASSFQEGSNYVVFTGVQSYNGQIQYYIGANPVGLWAEGAINTQGPFNGLQLVAIPEPSAFVMLGTGCAAFCLFRRRQPKPVGSIQTR
jgi:hypothetical protein